jgi:hypothetical protein
VAEDGGDGPSARHGASQVLIAEPRYQRRQALPLDFVLGNVRAIGHRVLLDVVKCAAS